MASARDRLETLARLHSVQLSYHDIAGTEHVASDEALVRILGALGVRAESEQEVHESLRARRLELARRVLEPVITLWADRVPAFALRVPVGELGGRYHLEITGVEPGIRQEGDLWELRVIESFELEGEGFADLELRLHQRLALGYQRLELHLGSSVFEALIISAPPHAYLPEETKMWGLFAPTYALSSRADLGFGGLRELSDLVDLTQEAGGHIVATLPLMASFLTEPFQPSPYVPVSRLFWNELFLDLSELAEVQGSQAALDALSDPNVRRQIAHFRDGSHVDYRAQAKLHRSILEILAREAFEPGTSWRSELDDFAATDPQVVDYARFRAVTETRQAPWPTWPERMKKGSIEPGDYDEASYRYHLYAQWRAEQQLGEVGARARAGGGGIYLDLPLGVHPDGYDAWRENSVFLDGVNAGAPPDALGPDGQDWGFRPLHPDALRAQHYRYFIECIRTQMRHAGVLRIDHVMGLHRIFCVPWGCGGSQGVYVRYRAEDLWAIITLESQRQGVMVVGEDLGTVPDEVRQAMDRRHIQRMFVLQFEMAGDRGSAIREVPSGAMASINTHDTPTFAGFWDDLDIADRQALGRLAADDAHRARQERNGLKNALCGYLQDRGGVGSHPSPDEVYLAIVHHLALGPARVVLLNLEDLWMETEPQNVPGTCDERPNWRRKVRYPMDRIHELPEVQGALGLIREARRHRPSPSKDSPIPTQSLDL